MVAGDAALFSAAAPPAVQKKQTVSKKCRQSRPGRLLLSGHDVCDHGLHRLQTESMAAAELLTAGETFRI